MSSVHVSSVRQSLFVFLLLMVFTGITIQVAYMDFGVLNTPLALSIAFAKALLVAVYFMHLRYSPKLMALMAGAALLWLVFMLALTLADYATRTSTPGW